MEPMQAIGPHGALLVYSVLAVLAIAAILVASALVRERHPAGGGRDRIYESGVIPPRSASRPFNVRYFLIAAFFVIFDMEAGILFGWAVAVREAGLTGLIEAAIFILVLLAALAWLWMDGALEWDSDFKREHDTQ